MKILFSLVPNDHDSSEAFVCEHGTPFYYNVTIEEDQFVLTDTIGRSIPYAREDLDELIGALQDVQALYKEADNALIQIEENEKVLDHIYG